MMSGNGNQEFEESVVKFLEEMLRAADLSVRVKTERQAEILNLHLHGADSALILANNARVLYSLEHLLNQVLFRRGHGENRVVLDCNGYRATRVLELQLMARKAAERVRATGSAFSLQPMPSFERRVIHVTLAEEAGVRTESSGLGMNRHVVIIPGQ